MLVQEGESVIIDALRADIMKNHPSIGIVDAPFFYGQEVFNECAATSTLMETLSIWTDAHPSIATVPMGWEYSIPFGVIYPAEPTDAVADFIGFIAGLQNNS